MATSNQPLKSRKFVKDYVNLPIGYLADAIFDTSKANIRAFIDDAFSAMATETTPGLLQNLGRTDADNTFSERQSVVAANAEWYAENSDAGEGFAQLRAQTNDNFVALRAYGPEYTTDEDLAGKSGLVMNCSEVNFIKVSNSTNGNDLLVIEGDSGPILTIKADLALQIHEYGEGFLKSDATGNITSEAYAGSGAVDDGDLSENVPLLDNTLNHFTGNIRISGLPEYANNGAAVAGGLQPGALYGNSGNVKYVTF